MAYIRSMLLTAIAALVVVAGLNITMDPARIYHGDDGGADRYARDLLKSPIGLYLPVKEPNERMIARALLEHAPKVECAVIGSSHVMQISSARRPAALADICSSILNVGVNGASIEDHVVLAYYVWKSGIARKIVFGVDPWTFAFNKDERWILYAEDFEAAKTAIYNAGRTRTWHDYLELGVTELYQLARFRNLINMEYTIRSLTALKLDLSSTGPVAGEAFGLDPAVGGPALARLKDGSHVYSAKFIADARKAAVPVGGQAYKTGEPLNQAAAIGLYRDMLAWLRANGIEPVLLLTPYHQNVWKDPDSPNVVVMRQTEPIVREIAAAMKIRLYGSYDPEQLGCPGTEFYDFMHPDAECLARIRPD